jgi:ABC-2 type transport system ATP-binding protein
MSIEVENVTKFYGSQKVLDQVSFRIGKGEITGFIGPNGAGKSTMMKIITGYIPLSSGKVNVKDMDVHNQSLEIRRIIGYLPESNPLYPHMYVKEYLLFVASLYNLGRRSISRVDEMIEKTGLKTEMRKKIGMLSKGYRQRVGLASALVHDPQVLILDEPTSGLDPNQIVEIRNLISEAGKEKTVMLSTHIMQEVEAICNRIIIINKGQIVANAGSDGILNPGNQQQQIILAEFNRTIEQSEILAIPGVSQAILTRGDTWIIEGESPEDLREIIFHYAVEKGLTVLSLQKQEKSLEEIFRELTK